MKLRDILSRHICLAGMVLLGNGPFVVFSLGSRKSLLGFYSLLLVDVTVPGSCTWAALLRLELWPNQGKEEEVAV